MYTGVETFGEIVAYRAKENNEKRFIRFENEDMTYRQFDEGGNKIANVLSDLGLQKGNTCAVMLDNCPEFLMAWLGLARLGIMEVPINTGLRGNLLTYILNQSECKAIFIASEWIDRILEIESELKYLETVIVAGEKQNDISLSRLDIYMFKSLMNTADFKKSK